MELEDGFIIADYYNLPKMDSYMVAHFFASNKDFFSGLGKLEKPPEEDCYGDDAIGYVQLKRDSNICTVKCNVCPYEPSKSYSITINVDEDDCRVASLQCHECTVGCVHSVAFLLWLHRRSMEPDMREHKQYWEKSFNALVGTKKIITCKELGGGTKRKIPAPPRDTKVLDDFVRMATAKGLRDCPIVRYHNYTPSDEEEMSLYNLVLKYKEESVDEFIGKISPLFTMEILKNIEKETRKVCNLWHELRYARITPLMAYDVMECQDSDTALELEAIILGEIPDPDRLRKKRLRVLESALLQAVQKALGRDVTKSGLFISKDYPMIAGSPDGVGKDFLVQIKCPKSQNTAKNYVKNEIQLQMYICGMKKGYLCVADSEFKNTDNVNIVPVDYDEEYVNSLLESLLLFWKTNIYPLLFKVTQD